MNDSVKRRISIVFLSLGIVIGLFGWVAVPTRMSAFGVDESRITTILDVGCLILFGPVCVVAFWKRKIAGVVFVVLSILWALSTLIQLCVYGYDITNPGPLACLFIFACFGAFTVMTEQVGWPTILKSSMPSSHER